MAAVTQDRILVPACLFCFVIFFLINVILICLFLFPGFVFFFFQACRAKLLNADWLRQRAFFLSQEGTFGNQEGMIT